MMHISFNTEALTTNEVRGLKSLLEAIAGNTAPNARERMIQTPDQTGKLVITFTPDESQEAPKGLRVADFTETEIPQPDPGALQNFVDAPHVDEPTPTAVEEPAKRKRRTKAEMEADAAKEAAPAKPMAELAASAEFNHKLALMNDQMDAGKLSTEKRQAACKAWMERYAADPAKAMVDIEIALGANKTFLDKLTNAEPLHAYTVEELRPMLQDYTERRSMQDGLDLLEAFECARVTDVTKLSVEKQAEFVGRLHG